MKRATLITLAIGLVFPLLTNAQTAVADNKVSQSITFHAIPSGPQVIGIFQGRPPCNGLLTQLNIETDTANPKLKCTLVLYRDVSSGQAGNYELSIVGGGPFINSVGNHYRGTTLNAKWDIIKGMPGDSNANVYRLQLSKTNTYLYLLKGDDNVLFVLDEKMQPRTGNEDFSYTLNRVELVAGKP